MDLLLRRPVDLEDWLINIASGCRGFCHVAIRFSNGEIFESKPGVGVSISTYQLDSNWKVIPIHINPYAEPSIYSKAQSIVGNKYDWWSIARYVFRWLPYVKESPVNYTCNEAVIEIFQPDFIDASVEAWKCPPNYCEDLFRKYGLIV